MFDRTLISIYFVVSRHLFIYFKKVACDDR